MPLASKKTAPSVRVAPLIVAAAHLKRELTSSAMGGMVAVDTSPPSASGSISLNEVVRDEACVIGVPAAEEESVSTDDTEEEEAVLSDWRVGTRGE